MFSVDVRRVDGVCTVQVAGELDAATAPLLKASVTIAPDDTTEALAVDLAGLSFIDAQGVRALLELRDELLLDVQGGTLVVTKPSRRAERVFRLLVLTDAFKFDPPQG